MTAAVQGHGATARIVRWLDVVLMVVAGALVGLLLVVVTAGIVTRAVNHPLSWTDELSGYIMVWLACFGWMIAVRHAAHIRVRYFLDLLAMRGHAAVEAAVALLAALLGIVVAWTSVQLVRTNSDVEAVAMPIMAAWLYVPLLPAGLMTTAQALADFFKHARRLASGDAP